MNRIRALVLAASLLLCAAPMLATTASAAEINAQDRIDQFEDTMDSVDDFDGFLTEEQVEKIKEFLSELLNIEALSAASDAINIFFENTYIFRVFFTAFLMSLIAFIMRGN